MYFLKSYVPVFINLYIVISICMHRILDSNKVFEHKMKLVVIYFREAFSFRLHYHAYSC